MATTAPSNQDFDYLQLVADSGKQLVSTMKDVQGRTVDAASSLVDQANSLYSQAPVAEPAKAINIAFDLGIELLELQRDLLLRLANLLPTVTLSTPTTQGSTRKVATAA
jgi:hypothetical protein